MSLLPHLQWATPFGIHTPSCGRFTRSLQQGECDFQMDWLIQQLHLKFTPPLCITLVQSTTEGVQISCGSIQWANPLELILPRRKCLLETLFTGDIQLAKPRGCVRWWCNAVRVLRLQEFDCVSPKSTRSKLWLLLHYVIILNTLLGSAQHYHRKSSTGECGLLSH